uniref:Uncharacterized protein n=1 Tax=Ditylenchus dipsaci TaxID=166011 RepID=A0A915DHR0_9BILA
MELYLFRPEEHHRLYGCANITVEDVPLEKRQHITEGVITIVLCAIYYVCPIALQVFIISLLNFTTTSIYVSMMYIVPNEFVIHLGQFCWLHLHGLPPVVFLLFNSTMREDSYKMLNLFINKENKKFTTGLAASTSKLHFSNTKN